MVQLKINSVKVDFPYKPYPAQIVTMCKIIACLQESSTGLVESPTGSGKSLAILCSVLAYLKHTQALRETDDDTELKVYICSRTHKQIDQLIDQLKKTVYTPRISILASRNLYCILPALKGQKDIDSLCTNLIKKKGCSFFGNKDKLISKLKNSIWDIEDIKIQGKSINACPFFSSRALADTAEVIFAPYNYIVDPKIRAALNINLTNAVVIIDEAHNIEDFCRSAGSIELTSTIIDIISNELITVSKKIDVSYKKELTIVMDIIKKFGSYGYTSNKNITESCVFKGKDIIKELLSMGIDSKAFVQFKDAILKILSDENIKAAFSQLTTTALNDLGSVLETIFMKTSDCYVLALQRDKLKSSSSMFMINFWLLDPSIVFKPLVSQVKSLVLLSGTLQPFTSFKTELMHEFKHKIEAPHLINQKNVFVRCISSGYLGTEILGTYANVRKNEYLSQICKFIVSIKEKVGLKGGTLVFVPSYNFINTLYEKMGKISNIFVEPQSNTQFDKVFKQYKKCIGRESCVLLCVYRGRASEGMDFKDSYCRAVIAVGIPYPNFKDLQVVCKREYNNANHGNNSGGLWYEMQAYRAINQAVGRVLRHKDDYGGVFLVDSRYAKMMKHLSKWVRDNYDEFSSYKECIAGFGEFMKDRV